MFADIVGFTSTCQKVSPNVVMDFLNELYSPFDELASIYKVYKVGCCLGDSQEGPIYGVVGGKS